MSYKSRESLGLPTAQPLERPRILTRWRRPRRVRGARFDVERCDGQSACADRRGGLRRSSRQAAAVVGSMGACDRDRSSPTSVISSKAEKSHIVGTGDPSASFDKLRTGRCAPLRVTIALRGAFRREAVRRPERLR
jgi:hypothetical protein